jgi:hypothetical protein
MPDTHPGETWRYQSFTQSKAEFPGNAAVSSFIAGKIYSQTNIFWNQPDITTIPAKEYYRCQKWSMLKWM